MTGNLSSISDEVWTSAAEHLNTSGVFADEGSRLQDALERGDGLTRFEHALRAKGYRGGSIHLERLEEERNGISVLFFDSLKLPTLRAAELAWDSAYWRHWHDRVQARVADWLTALAQLRATIEDWLPAGYTHVDRTPVAMQEELMSRFGVPDAAMPTYDILHAGAPIVRVLPRALWTIGGNGRVDLVGRHMSYMLVNRVEHFAAGADWHYYRSGNKLEAKPFDKPAFLDLLD